VSYHEPVMAEESVDGLRIAADGTYVDVTFGGGGHSKKILQKLGEKGRLIAFDQDDEALANRIGDERLVLVNHNFRYLKKFLRYHEAIPVDGILADLGVSSHQFDEAHRGFSIRFEADLDMRMNQQQQHTALDVLNSYSAEALQQIFSTYGEVHNAKTAAQRIVTGRNTQPVKTSGDLREMLSACMPRGAENQYLAKIFQALRIEVNDELGALKEMLTQCAEVLKPGGRLVVIAYHSLEDRLVKNFMRDGNFEGPADTDLFGNKVDAAFRLVSKKPVEAGEEEVKRNPRARSAKMRIAEKI